MESMLPQRAARDLCAAGPRAPDDVPDPTTLPHMPSGLVGCSLPLPSAIGPQHAARNKSAADAKSNELHDAVANDVRTTTAHSETPAVADAGHAAGETASPHDTKPEMMDPPPMGDAQVNEHPEAQGNEGRRADGARAAKAPSAMSAATTACPRTGATTSPSIAETGMATPPPSTDVQANDHHEAPANGRRRAPKVAGERRDAEEHRHADPLRAHEGSKMQRLARDSLLRLHRLAAQGASTAGDNVLDMRADAPRRDQAVHLAISNVLGVENRGYSRRPGAMRGVGTGNNPKGIEACSMVNSLLVPCSTDGCQALIPWVAAIAAARADGRERLRDGDGCGSAVCVALKGGRWQPTQVSARELCYSADALEAFRLILDRPALVTDEHGWLLSTADTIALANSAVRSFLPHTPRIVIDGMAAAGLDLTRTALATWLPTPTPADAPVAAATATHEGGSSSDDDAFTGLPPWRAPAMPPQPGSSSVAPERRRAMQPPRPAAHATAFPAPFADAAPVALTHRHADTAPPVGHPPGAQPARLDCPMATSSPLPTGPHPRRHLPPLPRRPLALCPRGRRLPPRP